MIEINMKNLKREKLTEDELLKYGGKLLRYSDIVTLYQPITLKVIKKFPLLINMSLLPRNKVIDKDELIKIINTYPRYINWISLFNNHKIPIEVIEKHINLFKKYDHLIGTIIKTQTLTEEFIFSHNFIVKKFAKEVCYYQKLSEENFNKLIKYVDVDKLSKFYINYSNFENNLSKEFIMNNLDKISIKTLFDKDMLSDDIIINNFKRYKNINNWDYMLDSDKISDEFIKKFIYKFDRKLLKEKRPGVLNGNNNF